MRLIILQKFFHMMKIERHGYKILRMIETRKKSWYPSEIHEKFMKQKGHDYKISGMIETERN